MDEIITVLSLVIIAIFVANLVLAYKMSEVAAMKGYGDEVHAWAWCIWLGIFGYIYVLSLPDKVTQDVYKRQGFTGKGHIFSSPMLRAS